MLDVRGQLLVGLVDGEAELVGQRLHDAQEVLADLVVAPGGDGALVDGLRRVGHDELGVDLHAGAESVALRARAERGVERERAGLQLVDGEGVVVGAGELLGEAPQAVLVVVGQVDEVGEHEAVGEAERGLDGLGEPLLHGRLDLEAVDDDGDRVLLLLGQLRGLVGEVVDLAVDERAAEALRLELAEQLEVLALAPADDGREDLEAAALGHREDAVDDLLRGLTGDRLTALGAVRAAGAGVEQAEVVVDLGDGADRGPRVARRGLLVDGDGRRQALDEVDVGLVHLAEELPGVGRQRLDVPALSLGEDRVERERGLARARQAREDDEGVAWEVERHVLEVVLAGAADDDRVGGGTGARSGH